MCEAVVDIVGLYKIECVSTTNYGLRNCPPRLIALIGLTEESPVYSATPICDIVTYYYIRDIMTYISVIFI